MFYLITFRNQVPCNGIPLCTNLKPTYPHRIPSNAGTSEKGRLPPSPRPIPPEPQRLLHLEAIVAPGDVGWGDRRLGGVGRGDLVHDVGCRSHRLGGVGGR
jgi:hypothetical protein